jgi:NitT/TauT family transport system substrate-binding protein
MRKAAMVGMVGMFLAVLVLVGCKKSGNGNGNAELPVFNLATSEYPSWSTYMVAGKGDLINPKKGGEHGRLEKQWGVDVVLEVKDYDACLTMFGSGTADAVCMTNMDSLNPALTRACTAICPTSTSVGADKVIAVGVEKPEELKGMKVYGLEKSVSEYLFVRGLEKNNLNPADFSFANLDPAAAATALQTGSEKVKAICVWNPFALQTLRKNKDAKNIFDSSVIPEEIIDMVVIGNNSLKKEKGEAFAACLCDIYYEVNKQLESDDKKVADAALTALGEDFADLPLEDMRIVVKETRFYKTPEAGIKLFKDEKFQNETMPTVVKTCEKIGVLEEGKKPTIGYGDSSKQLNFDPQYMEKVGK